MEDAATKRARGGADGWPEAKRLRSADLILLSILEDGDPDPAAGDIDTVMKSLEEEITRPAPSPSPPLRPAGNSTGQTPSAGYEEPSRTSDLCYLLEASDDDLGLPPTPPADLGGDADEGIAGFRQMWGYACEIPTSDEALGFAGLGQPQRGEPAGCAGASLFDLDDVAPSWASDFLEFFWRVESHSTV